MKKAILSVITLLGFSLLMQAQTTKPVKTATDKMNATVKTTNAKVAKQDASTQSTKAKETLKAKTATTATTTTTGPIKKDGTADMRYKANKVKPAGPLKKDGTADKRYKANKVN